MTLTKNTLLSAALPLLIVLLTACGQSEGDKAYKKAEKAWKKGKLGEARTLFEKSAINLTGNEKKSQAFNNLGLVLWESDESEAAIQAFQSASELSGTISGPTLNLAAAQFKAGDLNQAEINLNQFIGKNPHNPAALTLLSAITADRLNQGTLQPEIAEVAFKNALPILPDSPMVLFNLAALYDQKLNQKEKASVYYQAYLKLGAKGPQSSLAQDALNKITLAENSSETHYQLGLAYFELKQYEQARDSLKNALQINKRNPYAHALLAQVYCQLKNWDNAEQEAAFVAISAPDTAEKLRAEIEAARK